MYLFSLFLFFLLNTESFAQSTLEVLVMGDWGGQGSKPYTTTDELDSAKMMGKVADNENIDMVWCLGDNFYSDGVKNEYDPRFNETFENVFTASSILHLPYWVIAGNHDHNGNVTGEIYYSNHSARWFYPQYWYNKIWKIPNTTLTVELVMIDTVLLSGMSFDQKYCDEHGIVDCPIQPRGPEDPELAQSQWDWIKDVLEHSTANYLIVAGHYPIWSIAEHGPTSNLVQNLNPLLEQYNATAYASGHDHTFEYIATGNGIGYVDTGGTHTCDSSTAHKNDIPPGSLKFHGCNKGGFTRFRFSNDNLKVYYYYGDSDSSQYEVTLPRRH